ncbi:hypothetical protein GCM10029963_45670 [Micromonospora andamanensis]|uniref:hypothetical protein n=1 Tax=Micromonospora andamanensis TaxID=1287068 RepID=UPI00194F0A84|nr:hypothetical protein [Micromonospora andamanensis]GIJ41357.1 hypothetical protein Vwe01_46820 [Micromonospora andamanensis]
MTDPTPEPTADIPRPAPTSGRAPAFAEPAFDPAEVVAQVARPPAFTGSGHAEGDLRGPEAPLMPPPGIKVPSDLAAALDEYDTQYRAWQEASDAIEEARDDARASRAARDAAIRAAGLADARGTKRPPIPQAQSEADEEAEVRIRATKAEVFRRDATATAREVDRLIMKYAPAWADEVVRRFGPALTEVNAVAHAALEASLRAESVLSESAHWRALAVVAELANQGVRVSEHQRARLASDLLDAMKTHLYKAAEAQHRAPSDLVSEAQRALGTLSQCDPGVLPAPDTIGVGAPALAVFRKLWEAATPERRQRLRNRLTGGRPFRFEQTD